MVQGSAIVTTADQYKVVNDLSIGTIFNDLERPPTQILRLHQYSTLNISVTVEYRDIITIKDE